MFLSEVAAAAWLSLTFTVLTTKSCRRIESILEQLGGVVYHILQRTSAPLV